MKRLKNILSDLAEAVELGSTAPKPLDVARAEASLRQVARADERYFALCCVMIVVLFAASIWIVLTHLDEPSAIKVVFAALGVTSAGLIRMMSGLWREKVATDMLIALVATMDDRTLKSIIAVLLRRLG